MNIKEHLAELIHSRVSDHLTVEEVQAALEVPKHQGQGDLAFPCFILAKALRKAPQMIAQEIAEGLRDDYVERVEVAGPYINFFFKSGKIAENVLTTIIEKGEHYGDLETGHGENICIDMSSPNIAKPMSMGHLRSTVIGNAIGNIVEKVGFHSVRINHLGDWGTQFGKLIVAYRKWGDPEVVKANPIQELNRLYVKFHQEAEKEPELDDLARAAFKKLEDGDEEEVELWKWMRSESIQEFQTIYDLLNISFDSMNGEAFYNDKMDAVIDELEEKGLLKIDNGATLVDLEKYDLIPALVKKSDGATLYMTRDLAAVFYRKKNYDFDQCLYVVGNEQSIHFKQLKAVVKEMGYDWNEDIHHIPFGLITQGGQKLSTRKGKVILLAKVLDEAIELARQQIESKNPALENKEAVAESVGVGAVVFHDLKNDRLNNFDFDLQEVVQFEGETGPYVQYANARAQSILRKGNFHISSEETYSLEDERAYQVVKTLDRFPAIVEKAYLDYEPSVIAKYALSLAQAFNKYYAHTRVLAEDDQQNARLALVYCVSCVLTESLRLLGVQAPKEM